MGVTVWCEGREVWSPGQITGHLFFLQMRALAVVYRQPCGIEQPLADQLEIERGPFCSFVDLVLDQMAHLGSDVALALHDGCMAVAIALYARLVGAPPALPAGLGYLRDRPHPRL